MSSATAAGGTSMIRRSLAGPRAGSTPPRSRWQQPLTYAWRGGTRTRRDGGCSASRPATARSRSSASRRGSRPGCAPGPSYTELKTLVRSEGLHTVCEEAGCPNIFECWEDREATFLIGGDQCTRRCDFCQIDTGKPAAAGRGRAAAGRRVGRRDGPEVRDRDRRGPRRPARRRRLAVRADLPRDPCRRARLRRGAAHPRLQRRARTGSRRSSAPGRRSSPTTSRPCRGSSGASGRASGTRGRSRCCGAAREAGLVTKSNLILGLGEERQEITRGHGGPAGGRLRPADDHPVPAADARGTIRWSAGCKPEEFVELREEALELGFAGRDVRAAGAVLLPGRAAVRAGHRAAGRPTPRPVIGG